MVYNEPDFFPLWVRYYSGQVGRSNCYVIDHGTDDGSTQGYDDLTFLRLARSPHDDRKRVGIVSRIVATLLSRYDTVIYTDVDEFVFADPRLYASLPSFAASNTLETVTAYGFELFHLDEPGIDMSRPILQQRRWARFNAAMCKPAMVCKPIAWVPGFHCSDQPVAFAGLFLFHLRWFDENIAVRRLAKTRAQPWADPDTAPWQRMPDAECAKFFAWNRNLPRIGNCSFSPDKPPLKGVAERFLASQAGRETEFYKIDLHIPVEELWEIPEAFGDVF